MHTIHKLALSTQTAILLLTLAGARADEAPVSISKAGFRLTLPANWKSTKAGPAVQRMLAVRHDDEGKKIADIYAASLNGSAKDESAELAEIDDTERGKMFVEKNDTFKTDDGIEVISLLMKIAAKHTDYGSPLMFWSLYYPLDGGGSVTFKVRCGADAIEALAPEVLKFAKAAKFDGPVTLPAPGGTRVTKLAQLLGAWNVAAIEEAELPTSKSPGMTMQFNADGTLLNTMKREGKTMTKKGQIWISDEILSIEFEGETKARDSEVWLSEDSKKLTLRAPNGRTQLRLTKLESK